VTGGGPSRATGPGKRWGGRAKASSRGRGVARENEPATVATESLQLCVAACVHALWRRPELTNNRTSRRSVPLMADQGGPLRPRRPRGAGRGAQGMAGGFAARVWGSRRRTGWGRRRGRNTANSAVG